MELTEYFTVEKVAREVRLIKEKVIVYCKVIEKYCETGIFLFEMKKMNKGMLIEVVDKTMAITEVKLIEE